ncbi:hypothetical protein [Rubritalea profundi]|nr:hypothetical protein [Rubritalea profundi]
MIEKPPFSMAKSKTASTVKISGKQLATISKRSFIGVTALRAMLNRGVNIHSHEAIAEEILNQPANRRPKSWRFGFVAEFSSRGEAREQVDALEALELEGLPEIDMDQELKRLNSLLSETTDPDTVDMLAKKISSLHKSVVTQARLDSLVPRGVVDKQEAQAMQLVRKHLAPLYLDLPRLLINLEVSELTQAIQANVETSVLKLQTALAN